MPAPYHSKFFTGRMPFLPPNQQRQSTEGIYTQACRQTSSTAIFHASLHSDISQFITQLHIENFAGLLLNTVHQIFLIPFICIILSTSPDHLQSTVFENLIPKIFSFE